MPLNIPSRVRSRVVYYSLTQSVAHNALQSHYSAAIDIPCDCDSDGDDGAGVDGAVMVLVWVCSDGAGTDSGRVSNHQCLFRCDYDHWRCTNSQPLSL